MRASMACTDRAAVLTIAVSMSVLCAIVGPAAAQQPTKAQENALRSACSSDFRSYCSNVKPSGGAAMACLQRNAASLSAPCRKAVSAVGGGSAPAGAAPAAPAGGKAAAPPPSKAQENALRSACSNDFRSHCSSVKPGGPAALACLQRNAASLSAPCRTAVSAAGGASPAAAGSPGQAGIGSPGQTGAGSPGQTGTGSPGQTPGADVASVEWVSGRVIAFSLGKPALLLNSDIISDRTQLDLQADSELQICHYKANRILTLRGPVRALVSAEGVTAESGRAVDATAGTCRPGGNR